jgi:hypothetical protein
MKRIAATPTAATEKRRRPTRIANAPPSTQKTTTATQVKVGESSREWSPKHVQILQHFLLQRLLDRSVPDALLGLEDCGR